MMDVKEKAEISWMPPLRGGDHGWLIIDKVPWLITSWHHFDDFGQTMETVHAFCAQSGESDEFYSTDDGRTWIEDLA